jgi:hypothetical protein
VYTLRSFACLLALGAVVSLYGQNVKSTLFGSVKDSSGKAVPGASVVITNQETGWKKALQTDAQGLFPAASYTPGSYRVEVERQGYRKHVETIDLAVNQEVRLEIPLLPGQLSEEVRVTGTVPLLRTENAAIGGVIDNRFVVGLPLDGRNFYELSLLLPGVVPAPQGSASTVRGNFAVSINGAREDQNNYLLDGAYNGDPQLNTVGVTPPVDAVREFEVLTSSYDATFGRNGGGQVSAITRSGSNQFHGTVYEFFRNSALDSRNYFAPADQPAPKNNRNQFGFNLSGPAIKNRTFFFVDYEGLRVREGITRLATVPSLADRNGDFTRSPNPPRDPLTGQVIPFIPPQFQNPISRNILNLYPLPNRTLAGGNYVSSPTQVDDLDRFDIRVDHALSNRDQLTGRYSFGDRSLFLPFSGPAFAAVPGYGNTTPSRSQNAMISETHTFTPTVLNEVRVSYNRVARSTLQENYGTSLNKAVGMPELSSNPRDWGLSYISIPGYTTLGDEYNNPQRNTIDTYQAADTVTFNKGRHSISTGIDFRYHRQNGYRDVQSRGAIYFLGFITGNPYADFLLGYPSRTLGAKLDNPQRLRTHSLNWFVRDTFRIRPNLTLDLGLRYDYNRPPVDALDRANVYNPATGTLSPVGQNGFPRAGYDADYNNFAPRLGLAWSVRPTTVVRAGYGMYYDQSPFAPGEGLYFSQPYYNFSVYFPLPGLPLTINNPFPSNYPFQLPASALAFQRDLRTAYVQQWSFGIQQELGRNRVLEVAYVGSKGTKLIAARDINQPQPSNAERYLRPNPRFEDVNIIESRGNSNYNSLQARFQQRFRGGLSALLSYTYGKSIDDASGFFSSAGDANFPQNSYNVRAERGRSSFDVRQRFVASYGYDLPFGKGQRWLNSGVASTIFGGWASYGILTFQTGRPFTIALLPDIDNSNTGFSNLGFAGAGDRPNVVGNASIDNPTPLRWFNTGAFAISPRGTFGNAGRNILDGPGLATVNFSVVKNTYFTERVNLQFRAEFFNLFNRDNFDLPDAFLGSPTFGQIQSAQNPRRLQLGLKLMF